MAVIEQVFDVHIKVNNKKKRYKSLKKKGEERRMNRAEKGFSVKTMRCPNLYKMIQAYVSHRLV